MSETNTHRNMPHNASVLVEICDEIPVECILGFRLFTVLFYLIYDFDTI